MGVAKQALAPKHTAMINGLGLTPIPRAVDIAMGSSNTAVALLLKIWVLMLVSRINAASIHCAEKFEKIPKNASAYNWLVPVFCIATPRAMVPAIRINTSP